MRATRKSIGLLVAAGTLLFCTVQPVNGTTSTGCDAHEATCLENDVCRECVNSSVDPNDITEAECSAVYPSSFWTGSEGRSAGFCETSGATFCCAFDNTTVAEDCMSDAATVTYWDCLIADIGCELSDMPCYDGTDILTPAPSPTARTIASPTLGPSSTTSTSTSPSSTTTASSSTSPSSTSTASSSTTPSSMSTTSTACDADEVTCLEDDVCSECIDSSVDYLDITTAECSAVYPSSFTARGEGASPGFCETTGATFCCAFDNTTVAEDCMSDAATVTYWECLIADIGCELYDMPCYDGTVFLTPAPSSTSRNIASPTSSPPSTISTSTSTSPSSITTTSSSTSPSSTSTTSSSTTPSSMSTSSTACDADEATCLENDVCSECIDSSVDYLDISTAECSSVYPSSFIARGEGASPGFCETSGATFCCAFDNTTVAEDCMSDAATVTYWDCLITDIGCELSDMPCYDGTVFLTPAPSSTARTIASPSSTTSTSTSTSPSSTSTTSSSTNPSSISAACDADEATCLEHDVCSECIDSSVDYLDITEAECSAVYPSSFWTGSEGRSAGFCETSGATFCCAFDNTTVAEDCMSNAATVAYWDCLITDIGCDLNDMPCYDALSVTTPAPTPLPTASPTSSPSSPGGVDADASANGAAKMSTSSWVASVGSLLVIAAAGMLV